MKKQEIEHRMECLTAEVDALRLLLNEPEPRKPEAGDVWVAALGKTVVVDDQGGYTYAEDGYRVASTSGNLDSLKTCLGKHHEVYVKRDDFIRDVCDALSIPSDMGLSFLNPQSGVSYANNYDKSREALAKLGIKSQA
jgi:hypothetical protein